MSSTATPQKTALPVVPSGPAGACPTAGPQIDYELVLDCVHCGLCTSSCPTYVETSNEADSPRGRIYLMRGVIDGTLELDEDVKRHLDLCLNCRACETACPSGVQYGRILEPFRAFMAEREPGRQVAALNALQKFLLFHVFPYRLRNRVSLAPARLMQWSGLDWLAETSGLMGLVPQSLRGMKQMLPDLKPHYGQLPEVLEPVGRPRARVALFLGCVADALYPETNYATAKVLQANGCEVWIPRAQGCCGALHYHASEEGPAREFAAANCEAFGATDAARFEALDAIVTNAAGCGYQLKDYAHMMNADPHAPGTQKEAAARFQSKVRDISEFLMELGPVKPAHPLRVKATYHDACHLRHAQQIFKQPRALLEMIPGLELVPLPESELCCGAAGSYNLTQPEMADRLGKRKTTNIAATGARALFTGNVGCLMQITRHLKALDPGVWCAHPVDALWASYSGVMPKELE
ncbi:(Fe-S)-binding protein [Frigoriglobus tundricola]|uniref:Glycolate oxidase iron-sulfur subunit n=1 Tax=Frigoriglobus tundricola TaxID=2774151 RepID=A0A6M5YWK8_9BACT|nr:(Fe-S)-binding protein [Frigoriglobus tundricola]QJW98339.1 Glycolate dehydrogenase, iron-sulfur subunit GlcF [Frigoriglobus tundricola]